MSKQELTNYFFHNGSAEARAIRVVTLNGEPWFHATDVCNALEIKHTPTAVSRIAAERKCCLNLHLPGRAPTFVSEAGLYDLILQSRKAEAREFKDWITGTVLPAIRKDGAYIMGEEKVATGEMDEDAFVLKAIEILQRKIDRLSSENKQLTTERDGLSSVVGQHRHTLARFARTLPGININSVKRDLHRLGYLYRTPASYRVYRRFAHLLEEKFNEEYGKIEIYPTEEGKRLIAVLAQEGKLTKLKSAA